MWSVSSRALGGDGLAVLTFTSESVALKVAAQLLRAGEPVMLEYKPKPPKAPKAEKAAG